MNLAVVATKQLAQHGSCSWREQLATYGWDSRQIWFGAGWVTADMRNCILVSTLHTLQEEKGGGKGGREKPKGWVKNPKSLDLLLLRGWT